MTSPFMAKQTYHKAGRANKVTTAKQWTSEAIETALASQGIQLAPGRAERLARAQQTLLDASRADPLLGTLDFHADTTSYFLSREKTK